MYRDAGVRNRKDSRAPTSYSARMA
jgi:hypothetical protein